MRPIPLGSRGTYMMRVEPRHLANQFKDAILPPLLATPLMIMMMENAALNAIRVYLLSGENAVGTEVPISLLPRRLLGSEQGTAEINPSLSAPPGRSTLC
jgi:fluoroacetyl-CoA thioesterase